MINAISWNVNPIVFELGAFQLRYYGMFFVLGLIISYFILKSFFKKENIPVKDLDKLAYFVIIGGLLGARVGHCLFYEGSYYLANFSNFVEIFLPVKFHPNFQFVGYQGLASHGGAFGVVLAIIVYSLIYKKNFLTTMDRVVIPVGFAGACIRLGNLFNSEIFGHSTYMPWGFRFIVNLDEHFNKNLPAIYTNASHPTQIYEALFYILTSIILILIYKNEKFRNKKGFIFGTFLILIFLSRFFIEFLKNEQVEFETTMVLNMGQILSIPLIVFGIVLIVLSFIFNNSTKIQKK